MLVELELYPYNQMARGLQAVNGLRGLRRARYRFDVRLWARSHSVLWLRSEQKKVYHRIPRDVAQNKT
jgi:hypothetical protein